MWGRRHGTRGCRLDEDGEWACEYQRGIQMNEISNWSDVEARKDTATTRSKVWPWILALPMI